MKKRNIAALLCTVLFSLSLGACGQTDQASQTGQASQANTAETSSEAASETSSDTQKSLVWGDTTFNTMNGEPSIDPHADSGGWACIRYGVGETLFHFSDAMEMEPWLAEGYKNIDELTWEITLRDGVRFSNGKAMDANAVKACLETLIAKMERAASALHIDTLTAEGQTLTIRTTEPVPTLLNYLCDPYGCIIDVDADVAAEGIVIGTGPYKATALTPDTSLELVRNEEYWGDKPALDTITVRTISDSDTITMALQSGEIDVAYGIPYSSYPLFENDYTFAGCATSRVFFGAMNFESEITSDPAVRKAIAMGIDKNGFVDTLLNGNGYPATGVFPASLPYGGDAVKAKEYDPEGAKEVLEAAGWKDTDGDGIREKDGKPLTLRWLTLPNRQELPLLAEYAQSTLGDIGFDVQINNTANYNSIRQDPSAWDVYFSAMITAPTGDPEYFFAYHCLDRSGNNDGHYHSDELEALHAEMSKTFDPQERQKLAVQMQQTILDDDAFLFVSHLRMNMIAKPTVKGLAAHTTDYYEITPQLDIAE
ncbi:MAG: ABC transporter substrate-binding protein [Eubacteriales bacterium]|nr:ABC transporter substrate-binding protein [Eubacteriales bacterium]